MGLSDSKSEMLYTSAGDFPLEECRLRLNERDLKVLHVAAMLSDKDESQFLIENPIALPYGIALWSATIALAHEIAARAEFVRGKKVLELGAGTGLPGIAAAALGAEKVVQTDRNKLAMWLCQRNCELNRIENIEHRVADWSEWNDCARYDFIFGSDILYATDMHAHLKRIFESNLKFKTGRILLSDPLRSNSLQLLEAMQADGWTIIMHKWTIGAAEESTPRAIAVFELSFSP